MSTEEIKCKVLRVSVHLRDNSSKDFVENVQRGSGDSNDLKSLSDTLLTMQKTVNTFLTGLVEQERGTTENNQNNVTAEDDEDDDEEDDDSDADVEEPPVKLPKR